MAPPNLSLPVPDLSQRQGPPLAPMGLTLCLMVPFDASPVQIQMAVERLQLAWARAAGGVSDQQMAALQAQFAVAVQQAEGAENGDEA